ncbi:MAG TPA: serine hydrolase domain-containing protein [Pseudolabrys sp.]|nr:serine hydrolase domain-containing protein [Pseudolabrys sp.]
MIALGEPPDGLSSRHTTEYYQYSAPQSWHVRVGEFQFGNLSTLGNISARALVQTGDNVMIGGFMVQGTEPKRVIIRAIGPELIQYGVPYALPNPTLELHDRAGALIASNNNWVSTIIGGVITINQVNEIRASGYAPGDPFESAIIADLPAGNYTAIVRGVNNMTGVALVEVYGLSPETNSILGNISARGFVQTGDNMMIGGFMVQGTEPKRVIIRAIGPELTQYGVPDTLANPTLELHDGAGALIASNDDWQHTIIGGIITAGQVAAIQSSGHAPTVPDESAIIATLPPGSYTAVVRGKNNTTGAALVEVYDLGSRPLQPTYDAAIQEGQTAAQELINDGASAIAIALVDDKHIIWSQGFGLADRDTGRAPANTTMFGVGSVSKIFAAIAVMQLVDRGVVDLDTPLTAYLPAFHMLSPPYRNITVRMLLNHSSGFPGTDYRNVDIRSPVPGYVNQVLQTLAMSRLKDPPGYMSVYCNDGFTITAALVEAMTGKSYVQFVHDEILTPLGMANTRYPISAFPNGSYAKAYVNGAVKPQEFVNTLAAGGAYSTADDVARVAIMFLNGGRVGTTRILSSTAVTEMAVDQTIGSFNPIHNDSFAFGLGWDSVSQPGLAAVGFDGWIKGGDSNDYGAAVVVSPQAQLGVVVLAASFGGSARATAIAERVLLRALDENGRIAAFPSPLLPVVPPVVSVPDGLLAAVAGEYALGNLIVQLQAQPDDSLQATVRSDGGWTPSGSPLKYRGDGWFASDQDPLKAFKVVDADLLGVLTQYIVNRAPAGYGHYLDHSVFAQRVRRRPGNLSAAWQARLSSTWLVVNENPAELAWNGMDPRLRLATVPNLDGLIAVRPPSDVPAPAAGHPDTRFHIVDPSASDSSATMMLIIPQLNGRDLDDLDIVERDGAEWTRFGSYMHRPLASVPVLPRGATDVVTIGPEGYAEWRAVASEVTQVRVTITTTGAWHLYDPAFTTVANGNGSAVTSLPAGSGLGYLTLFGDLGQTITVAVQ